MSVVGFDFGNQDSVIAVARRRGIDVLQNEVGKRKTPSMVAFAHKQRYLGDDAVAQATGNWAGSVHSMKRLLGRHWDDQDLAAETNFFPYKIAQAPGNKIAIEVGYEGKTQKFTPEQVSGALFTKLKQIAETGLEGSRVSDCVIGCPNWWNDEQRRALLDSANVAGLNVLRLINETTAVALNYGILRPLPKEETRLVLFVDVGHTSTSVALVAFVQGKLSVVATAADPWTGGRSFDDLLVQHFVRVITTQYKLDVASNPKAMMKIKKEAERVKTILSANQKVVFNIEYLMNDTDVKIPIERHEFEAMARGILDRLCQPIRTVLQTTNTDLKALHSVEVVGGAVRIPCVQAGLTEFVQQKLSFTCDGDESVARGCALMCAMLSPSFKVRPFDVQDLTPYGIELSWGPVNSNQIEDRTVLFEPRSPMPSVKLISFKERADAFQIQARYSDANAVPTGTNPLLGTWVVSGIPKAEKAGKIKVRVKMSLHGVLNVRNAQLLEELPDADGAPAAAAAADAAPEADDGAKMEDDKDEPEGKMDTTPDEAKPAADAKAAKKKTKRTDLKVEEAYAGGLTSQALKAYFEKEAEMAQADRVIAETLEARNALESYCLEMRSRVEEGGELDRYVSPADRDRFVQALIQGEEWLGDDGLDAQKSEYKARLDALNKMGDPITFRKTEAENREESIVNFKKVINEWQKWTLSSEEAYVHIDAEERKKVSTKCDEADNFLLQSQNKQDKLQPHDNPAFTTKELADHVAQLQKFCDQIKRKPKPAPPKPADPPKEEGKADDAAKKKDEDGDANMGQEKPKGGDMD